VRGFLLAFAIVSACTLTPFVALGVRLIQLGELGVDPAAAHSSLTGQLFADRAILKLGATRSVRPDVLILGSSRVGEFRRVLFAGCAGRDDCVYNATGAVSTLAKAADFLDALAAGGGRMPRVLLLGIDTWALDPNYELLREPQVEPLHRDSKEQLDYALAVTRSALSPVITDPAVRDVVLGRTTVASDQTGLAAFAHGTGDRPDGSTKIDDRIWRAALAQSDADRSALNLRLLSIGGLEFEPFDRADDAALRDLDRLIATARRLGVSLVVFTPPFGDALLGAMRKQPHFGAGLADAESRLDSMLTAHGIPHRVALDLAAYGCATDEHYDGLHVSEVCGARILQSLLGQADIRAALGPYADAAALADLVRGRHSSYVLTDEP